jgi:uncharacterized protein YxjI
MFDARRYEVREKIAIGSKYNVYEDGSDEPILQSKKKKLRLKEDFRFTDPESGEEVFRVRASKMLDVSAAYDIVDSRTGEAVGAVKRKFKSFAKHEYELLDADGNVVALVKEDSLLGALVRRFVTTLLPFTYHITSPDGAATYGEIHERFSFRDKYDIELRDGDLDPRLAVIGAVVIDAIEGN